MASSMVLDTPISWQPSRFPFSADPGPAADWPESAPALADMQAEDEVS
jgi:hypothetical protein